MDFCRPPDALLINGQKRRTNYKWSLFTCVARDKCLWGSCCSFGLAPILFGPTRRASNKIYRIAASIRASIKPHQSEFNKLLLSTRYHVIPSTFSKITTSIKHLLSRYPLDFFPFLSLSLPRRRRTRTEEKTRESHHSISL